MTAVPRLVIPVFFAFATVRSAAEPAAVVYDVLHGSTIVDDCLFCDRIPIERQITGSFELSGGPQEFALERVELRDLGGDYVVSGSGSYRQDWSSGEALQETVLEVEVNGTAGIELSSGKAPIEVPWPAIDAEATDAEPEDPLHVYTLCIFAAPRVPSVLYELAEGSFLTDDCLPCGRPTIEVPIKGTFLLGEIAGAPNPVSTYRIDAVDFRSAEDACRVAGAGLYRYGGEVAVLDQMSLRVEIDDLELRLASEWTGAKRRLPEIEVRLEQTEPEPTFQVFALHLVARPAGIAESAYGRGDTNADGALDISDPVYSLLWLFAGGPPPLCLDAGDVNDDEATDITDPIYLLQYLFQGGPPPPAPAPGTCGTSPNLSLGCERYPPCGV